MGNSESISMTQVLTPNFYFKIVKYLNIPVSVTLSTKAFSALGCDLGGWQ